MSKTAVAKKMIKTSYPASLSDSDYLDFYKRYMKVQALQERVGRLRAEASVAETQLQTERKSLEDYNQSLRTKYDLVDGDSVDLETGVISRSPRATMPVGAKLVATAPEPEPILDPDADDAAAEAVESPAP